MTMMETAARLNAGEIAQLKRKLAEYEQRRADAELRAHRAPGTEDR